MTAWRDENAGCFWAGKLDVRDSRGYLDVTQRALAGALNDRVKEATSHVIAFGALPMGFNECLGWSAPSTCPLGSMDVKVLLPLSTHSVHSDLRWHVQSGPKKTPHDHYSCFIELALGVRTQPSLLSGVGFDIGLSWDSTQAGWVRPGLPPLRMMTGPIQNLRNAIWQARQDKGAIDLCKRVFGVSFVLTFGAPHQLLNSSPLRELDKMLLGAILSGSVWDGFLLSKA